MSHVMQPGLIAAAIVSRNLSRSAESAKDSVCKLYGNWLTLVGNDERRVFVVGMSQTTTSGDIVLQSEGEIAGDGDQPILIELTHSDIQYAVDEIDISYHKADNLPDSQCSSGQHK